MLIDFAGNAVGSPFRDVRAIRIQIVAMGHHHYPCTVVYLVQSFLHHAPINMVCIIEKNGRSCSIANFIF